ncbi:hypothetical protein Glove_134g74 [Diversispora epigaea]|uniref:Uncharacterized protein n=1 Tax=Diversispora epigaea TaxID=1348612 RepID=A0A397IWU8_9GLOM|nr:hypothetical protein Glove_134g74 [Diversispora epigaea]
MSTRLSYHQKKQNKNRTAIAGIFSGHSRFVKSKKSEVSTSATAEPTRPASRITSRQASRTTSRQASLQSRQESPQPQSSSPHVIISRHLSPSPSQTTSRKRRKTKTGVTEIGDDDDDAPLTRKEAKIFFNELKKKISDVRKLLEISGVGDYTTEESFIKEFVGEIASYSINKYIYPNKKELKKSAGAISAKSYPEYFEHWEDDRWSYYYSKYIHSRLLAKHWSRRGAIATRVQSSFFSTFGESDLPTINTKSAASEVLSWKKSQKVKDVLRKLNQDIDGHENLTWCTKIMEKIWEKTKKVPKEKVAFTISIIQYLLSPKVESIKIDDEAIRKRMKKNIKKLEKGETIEFEEKSDEESELEEESEEESSKEEEKKSKEREEREEEEERRWEGEERRLGEERILEEERGREERQEGEERREEEERREIWNEELIEIISGGPTSEVLSWKKSQKVKDVLRKLNQDIDGHENLTWCTKIMEKIWEKTKKVPKEKVAFTISIIQYLLSPKVESIKIDDEAIRKRMKKNIKKLEKGETIEFEEKSDEESELEEESEEESSKEEEKKSKEREEREEEEERRWEGEERRLGEERILEEERGREERQEGEERREEEEEELIEIISGGPKEEKKSKEREEREEEEERRWEGEERRLGEERILEEERGREERQEGEERQEKEEEELIEIISGGPKQRGQAVIWHNENELIQDKESTSILQAYNGCHFSEETATQKVKYNQTGKAINDIEHTIKGQNNFEIFTDGSLLRKKNSTKQNERKVTKILTANPKQMEIGVSIQFSIKNQESYTKTIGIKPKTNGNWGLNTILNQESRIVYKNNWNTKVIVKLQVNREKCISQMAQTRNRYVNQRRYPHLHVDQVIDRMCSLKPNSPMEQ